MTEELSGVKRTQARAEEALKALILAGERVTQHAVEKKAGLANGALNYNCPEYRKLREVIRSVKAVKRQDTLTDSEQKIEQLTRLKDRYRRERNALREEIKCLLAENVELLHNLILLQQYVRESEKLSGTNKGVVVPFSSGDPD